jgi:hypothetical protein
MRQTRDGSPIFLGHSAIAAEVWLRKQLDTSFGPSAQ